MPETVTYILSGLLPYDVRVKITGIDGIDCLETLERRREEFRRLEGSVSMYTPRLQKLIAEKGLANILN